MLSVRTVRKQATYAFVGSLLALGCSGELAPVDVDELAGVSTMNGLSTGVQAAIVNGTLATPAGMPATLGYGLPSPAAAAATLNGNAAFRRVRTSMAYLDSSGRTVLNLDAVDRCLMLVFGHYQAAFGGLNPQNDPIATTDIGNQLCIYVGRAALPAGASWVSPVTGPSLTAGVSYTGALGLMPTLSNPIDMTRRRQVFTALALLSNNPDTHVPIVVAGRPYGSNETTLGTAPPSGTYFEASWALTSVADPFGYISYFNDSKNPDAALPVWLTRRPCAEHVEDAACLATWKGDVTSCSYHDPAKWNDSCGGQTAVLTTFLSKSDPMHRGPGQSCLHDSDCGGGLGCHVGACFLPGGGEY
jgi:hypothetical protein